MTPEQFTYWLQGYSEVSGEQPTKNQWQVIKDHLQTVFHKVTPTFFPPLTDGGFGTTGNHPYLDTTKIIC